MGESESNDERRSHDAASNDEVTRVRIDELSGEVVITKWRGDQMISETREPARED